MGYNKLYKRDIAKLLHEYMVFRAAMENQGYCLTPDFFLGALKQGVRTFFNIKVGPSGLISDTENPKAFAAWKAQQLANVAN